MTFSMRACVVKLTNGDAGAVGADVAQAQNALPVRDDRDPDVADRPLLHQLLHPALWWTTPQPSLQDESKAGMCISRGGLHEEQDCSR
jgi:hypothetical protein